MAQLLSSKATNPICDKFRSNTRNCEELAVEIVDFAVDRWNDDIKDNSMDRSAGWAKRSTTPIENLIFSVFHHLDP